MKKIYKIVSVFIIAASLGACESYFDVNTDPNNPLVENTNPDIVMPGAMTTTGNVLTTTMNQLGNLMVGNWGGNVINFAGPFDDEFRYNVTSSFYSGVWDNIMIRTANYTNIINYDGGAVNYDNHKAAARIMRAFYFQYMVDLYGNIPYFSKHLGTAGLNPSYDDATDIYRDLVTELNMAIETIDNASANGAVSMGSSDVMMGGDMAKWRRFANTIKLRVLLRQAYITDSATQTHISTELAGLTTADFVSTNVTMNPGYENDSANGRQNPFYATYGFDTQGSFANTSNNVVAASVFSIEFLDGTLTGVADPRLGRLWTAAGNPNPYQGINQGQLLGSLPAGGDTVLSKLGAGLGVDTPNDAGASMDAYIMTAAESFFLQAEAIERGYITGTAQTAFESGITASFNLLGLSNANATTYIGNSSGTNGIGWAGSSNKYEAIANQKFIALTSINGAEAWIELTRTGFPSSAPLSLTQTSGARPVRLLYPTSELSGNSANVPSQSTTDAFTSTIFWDVN